MSNHPEIEEIPERDGAERQNLVSSGDSVEVIVQDLDVGEIRCEGSGKYSTKQHERVAGTDRCGREHRGKNSMKITIYQKPTCNDLPQGSRRAAGRGR